MPNANVRRYVTWWPFLSPRFRVTYKPLLTSHFTRALRDLPEDYTHSSRLEYRQLINTYGTHYVSQLQLGGRVRDVTAVWVCEAALDGVTADEVKDCLSLEASVTIGAGKGRAQAAFSQCEEQKKKQNVKRSFHETDSERHTELTGGNSPADLLFSEGQDAGVFSAWMETLKASPGPVSYSLRPILGEAVSEYISERALWRNCTRSCPPGTQRSARDPCSCVCPGDGATNTMCRSRERGQRHHSCLHRGGTPTTQLGAFAQTWGPQAGVGPGGRTESRVPAASGVSVTLQAWHPGSAEKEASDSNTEGMKKRPRRELEGADSGQELGETRRAETP
ncbi:perforin-1-like [Macrochelys suwanniensis]